ncbi:MAG: pantetheine-phosphate adenylyltransferase [[Eubacterium] brachy]|jgi:pantetheine-phosphate adenylyltransferase|nr:pantetheine-phosphate adenylyltransferase [[Eubacterium] brachy]
MKKALYAGSFDPLTSGHVNIIERAASICDELVVGVIRNPQKAPYFTVEERVKLIEENVAHLGNVAVDSFEGLLAEYVNNGKFDVVIRGMRGTSDFDCEIQMAQMNARLYNDCVETVFLMTDPRYSFLSSSMAKEVYSLNGNLTGLVPENILKAMEEKKDDERR